MMSHYLYHLVSGTLSTLIDGQTSFDFGFSVHLVFLFNLLFGLQLICKELEIILIMYGIFFNYDFDNFSVVFNFFGKYLLLCALINCLCY
jgi:hypothetical protein